MTPIRRTRRPSERPIGHRATASVRRGLRGGRQRPRQRGAALLLALVTVALITTLAAAMVWQQWRAIQVETAERTRVQAEWILAGALDFARLIIREDGRTSRDVDDLTDQWNNPLAEARLSSFLAQDADNSADVDIDAFVSGGVSDAQARYNLRNLVRTPPATQGAAGGVRRPRLMLSELQILQRLCVGAALPAETADRLAALLAASWEAPPTVYDDTPKQQGQQGAAGAAAAASGAASGAAGSDAGPAPERPIRIQAYEQLRWLGVDEATLNALRDRVTILPEPRPLNINTASREVIAGVLGVDLGMADRIARTRPFQTVESIRASMQPLVIDDTRVGVNTAYFDVVGRMRIDERVLEERILLVRRRSSINNVDVKVVRRQRVSAVSSGT